MIYQLNWSCDHNKLLLFGVLDKHLLTPLWDKRKEIMKEIVSIDLKDIDRVDTAGLALLIHLIALRKSKGVNVTLSHVSQNVLSLVKLYNLPTNILPISL